MNDCPWCFHCVGNHGPNGCLLRGCKCTVKITDLPHIKEPPMSGNQLTNVQRALLLPELKAKWPHFIANPHDVASSVTDILNRLNISKIVSIETIRRYGAEMGLPPIPVIRKPKTAAQLASLEKARAARYPSGRLSIMDCPTPPNYGDTLERIANALSDISLTLRNIYTTQSDQSMILAKIHTSLEPAPKSPA